MLASRMINQTSIGVRGIGVGRSRSEVMKRGLPPGKADFMFAGRADRLAAAYGSVLRVALAGAEKL
ncbi:hypothetical protein AAKU55_001024 [Oxalobacteraceae bacterium GrIS 1.11]